MDKRILKTVKDIKELRVQGATNVAVSGLKALKFVKSEKEFEKASKLLASARPTEPMLRNGLKYVHYKHKMGSTVKEAVDDFLKMTSHTFKEIVEAGVRRIPDDSVVMTHCHSSLVNSILKKVKKQGKKISVVVSETRPLYQGRLTAKELSKAGIKVKFIVDSAMRSFVNDVDLCLVGADVLTADAFIVNKIGTSMLALAANEARTPFAVASELFKYDPETTKGLLEPIEKRKPSEVWRTNAKNVEVLNPAFDFTPAKYVNFIITEKGIINAFDVHFSVSTTYRWMF